jgi:hypothetical protein
MNLDAMHKGKRHASRDKRRKDGRPSNKKKEKCKKENLYYNCRESEHIIRNYKSEARSLHIINKETNPVAKKTDIIKKTSKATEGGDII